MRNLKIGFVVLIAISISSCSSLSSISNGGFSDVSLNRNSSEYELKRLDEINVEGKALFGIPGRASKRKGVVVRFNGIQLGKSSQGGPILTMILYTAASGFLINDIAGINNKGNDVLPLYASIPLAIPLAGIINNMTWSGAALQNASWNLNSKLVEDNPDIDLFLNPKYEIEYTQGIFNQKAKVKARVMGAIIKTD